MPITAGDILLKYSTTAGAAGNTQTGTPAGSLGKYISQTQMPSTGLLNLFDNISGRENRDLVADYRCIFIHNNHPTLTMLNAIAYIGVDIIGGANVTIGVESIGNPGASTYTVGSSTSQANAITDELQVPGGVTFTSPVSETAALPLGNIPAGQCKALWIKRQATNSGALDNDGITLVISCDSAA